MFLLNVRFYTTTKTHTWFVFCLFSSWRSHKEAVRRLPPCSETLSAATFILIIASFCPSALSGTRTWLLCYSCRTLWSDFRKSDRILFFAAFHSDDSTSRLSFAAAKLAAEQSDKRINKMGTSHFWCKKHPVWTCSSIFHVTLHCLQSKIKVKRIPRKKANKERRKLVKVKRLLRITISLTQGSMLRRRGEEGFILSLQTSTRGQSYDAAFPHVSINVGFSQNNSSPCWRWVWLP